MSDCLRRFGYLGLKSSKAFKGSWGLKLFVLSRRLEFFESSKDSRQGPGFGHGLVVVCRCSLRFHSCCFHTFELCGSAIRAPACGFMARCHRNSDTASAITRRIPAEALTA